MHTTTGAGQAPSRARTAGRRNRVGVEGASMPQGVSWIEADHAFNFSVDSKHAERVELLLYAPEDVRTPLLSRSLNPLLHESGRLWHCRISEAGVQSARDHAYRIEGPEPRGRHEWHAFDWERILLDAAGPGQSIAELPLFDGGLGTTPIRLAS